MRDTNRKLNLLYDLIVRHYSDPYNIWLEIENIYCWNCGKRLNGECPMEDGEACGATPDEEIDTYLELMLKEMKGEKIRESSCCL